MVAMAVAVGSAGCAQPTLDPFTGPQKVEPAMADDKRPEVGRRAGGDDITDFVRELNATSEPPAPTRPGNATLSNGTPDVVVSGGRFVTPLPKTRYPGVSAKVSTPAYYRGRIYAGTLDGYELHAIDAETHTASWTAKLSDHGPTAPGCEDGVCVFNTHSCTTFALDAETGEHLWSWWLGDPQLATPVIADGRVYTSYPSSYAGMQGQTDVPYIVAAFDLKTGEPKWRRFIDARVNAAPVAHDGRVYVASLKGTLYTFAERDGEVLAARRGRVASAPVVWENSVFFGHDAGRTFSETLAVAHPVFPELEKHDSHFIKPRPRPLVAAHRLIEIVDDNVIAVDRRSGRHLWKHQLSGEKAAPIAAPMLFAGESILLATAGGDVLRLSPDDGEVSTIYRLGGGALSAQPIVHDGWIYAGTHSGRLVGFDTGDRTLTGWPMFGRGPDRRGGA